MKKIIAIIGAFMLMAAPLTMNADNQKAAKKELDSKSSKTARKEAKKLEKKGGRQPLALSLLKSSSIAAISSSKRKMSWVIQNS